MSDELLYDVQDRIAHIQINRPKAMNAIHPGLMEELSALIREADRDDDRLRLGRGPLQVHTSGRATTSNFPGASTTATACSTSDACCSTASSSSTAPGTAASR